MPQAILSTLFEGLDAAIPVALRDVEVTGLTLDSRRVQAGDLFFALAGQHREGARFAAEALARGARGVVAARPVEGVATIVVAQPRRVLAELAGRFFGHPDRVVQLLGVTGTNGKTTAVFLLAAILEAAGEPPGLIGTLGARLGATWREGSFTTPEAPDLCALLSEMARAGLRHCAMEVSSHALAQDRVSGLSFAVAGFTNLTRDHLDFHGDLERYFAAKRRLFVELLSPAGVAVVNVDDPFGQRLAGELEAVGRAVHRLGRSASQPPRTLTLAIEGEALSLSGSACTLRTPRGELSIRSPLVGGHNVENLALAAGMALAAGFSAETVTRGLGALQAVPGRLERVASGAARAEPVAFVDYAHTDDALRRVLAALRGLGAHDARRLVVVFGCGGDRDAGKRPLMGRAAAEGADVVVATSDNPRSESPTAILSQVEPGIRAGGKRKGAVAELKAGSSGYVIEPDRRAAIALAVELATPADVVLVAGKGHETYQVIGDQRLPFDDRVELRAALERRAA